MSQQLFASLMRLAQVQGQAVDKFALEASVNAHAQTHAEGAPPQPVIAEILKSLHMPAAKWKRGSDIDPGWMPALLFEAKSGWAVVRGQNAQGAWLVERWSAEEQKWIEQERHTLSEAWLGKLHLVKPFDSSSSEVFKLIKETVLQHRKTMLEIALGGIMINVIALATSLYSMQVYDRVVPTGATQTLLALTLGAFLAMIFELVAKFVKSSLSERLVDAVDSQLARTIYTKFLAIRMDQLPSSVGGLAGQLKGYETVRGFLSSVPTQLMIDGPFLLLYIVIVMAIGGWIALIPLLFMVISLTVGISYRRKVEMLTQKANHASNLKTGLLVESIEGAETIKSGQAGWRMLMRWLHTTDEARVSELEMRQVSEHAQYWIATLHQVSYVGMVAAGALMVSRGEITMGSLIACTILSGRILGPIGTLPGILVQWGHCRAALQSLDRLWSLQGDHHGVDHPIVLQSVAGAYQLEGVEAVYGNNKALQVNKLQIMPGEKVAVLGPVGAGKTTLLRLLSGMYKPQKGMVKLDDVDLSHISKPVLAEQIGFLQQEGRLFAGTVRDNLVLGLMDPGDQVILDVAKLTGLQASVLANHPMGLKQPITEGGLGLSGGQKQLTNLTRVFLRKPRIWLLDEPTASLDRNLEITVMQALGKTLRDKDTLVLVTHKPEMLALVNRIIVVANHQIIMDGPKNEVLMKLQQGQQAQAQAAARPTGGTA